MEQNHFCISSFFTITKKRNCITPNRALSSPPSLGSAAWDPLIPESGKPLHRNKASLSSLLFQHDIIQVGGWILLWMLVCYETAQLYIYIYIFYHCSVRIKAKNTKWCEGKAEIQHWLYLYKGCRLRLQQKIQWRGALWEKLCKTAVRWVHTLKWEFKIMRSLQSLAHKT